MTNSLQHKLKLMLIDWLIAMLVVSAIIWFAMTQPVFSNYNNNKNLQIDKKKLRTHVVELFDNYSPRTIEYGYLNSTADYIHKEFQSFGDSRYQVFHTLAENYRNVILQLGPDTKEILVIGAHFDAENDSLDTEGNASGVATLIELARHLSMNAKNLPIKVQLVAYSLSQGSNIENMGSYFHVESLIDSGSTVKLMISLDSVGSFNNHKGSQKYPHRFMNLLYPDRGNYISLVSRLQDYSQLRSIKKSFIAGSILPLQSFNIPEYLNRLGSSDHRNFWRKGIPAVLITDTARYREVAQLHATKRLDYEKMSMLVQGLYKVVMDMKSEKNVQLVLD